MTLNMAVDATFGVTIFRPNRFHTSSCLRLPSFTNKISMVTVDVGGILYAMHTYGMSPVVNTAPSGAVLPEPRSRNQSLRNSPKLFGKNILARPQ